VSARAVGDRTLADMASTARNGIRAFYSRPLGWLALGVTSAVLAYGGGGVMFWFHAIYRGEQGPPISPVWHWLYDCTLGFMALTPALFLILPFALAAVRRAGIVARRFKATAYVALVGVLFGVVTGPGPILHDALVGRDAPLGRLAVDVFGRDPGAAAGASHSMVSEVLLQVVVGVPVYTVAALLALGIVRSLAGRRVRHVSRMLSQALVSR
jgi:hypothetical protein